MKAAPFRPAVYTERFTSDVSHEYFAKKGYNNDS
jgi:hypothetical protein